MQQIGARLLRHATLVIARQLIGQLDEAGYLRPISARHRPTGSACRSREVEAVLALVHGFDPTGVGARTLAECIALQAQRGRSLRSRHGRLIDNLDLVARAQIRPAQAHLRRR